MNAHVPERVSFFPSLLDERACFFHENLINLEELYLGEIRHYLIICMS